MTEAQPRGALWRDPCILAALLAALALRLAMARGGLWLDEAWSLVMASDVGTPLGVVTSINHDNNHPLNSWWLQLVGLGAPPMIARALSIGCSVATLLPAAAFAARRGVIAGRSAAWLFALSPMLVLLGSEARGYAPMLLAVTLLVELLDPTREGPPTPTSLALSGLFGTLGHLLMLPAILLVGVWLWLARGWRAALATIPALVAALAVALILLGSAYATQGGLTIGSSTSFSWRGFADVQVESAHLTLGISPLVVLLAGALLLKPRPNRTEASLWLVLGLGVSFAASLVHPANSHISRYYILATPALLWLAASRAGILSSAPRIVFLAPILLAMGVTDIDLIATARGEPDLPVRRIAIDHPGRANVLIGASRLSAVITVAAAEQHLMVVPSGPACAPADYLLIDLANTRPPPRLLHCATRWTILDHRLRPYHDGAGWALYRRAGLPAPGPVASGPPPAL